MTVWMRQFIFIITVILLVACVPTSLSIVRLQEADTPAYESILTKSEAVERALNGVSPDTNPRVLDARLIHNQDLDAIGQKSIQYDSDAPMWIVTVETDGVDSHPMLPNGSTEYTVQFRIYSAADGQFIGERLMKATDPDIVNIQSLTNLDGSIEITPRPKPTSFLNLPFIDSELPLPSPTPKR